MATLTRRIGLSLGADTCWPLCYEAILKRLDLALPVGGDTLRFEVERVTIEPFALRQPTKYDVVVDRLTHWYPPTREWIKKSILLDGLYVFNNPWSVQANEKNTTYAAMIRLGLPIPETWLVPPKDYEEKPDLRTTLVRYARLFDLGEIGAKIGYPSFMKPYDGGGWVGVTKIDDEAGLRAAYEASGRAFMLVQKGIVPFDVFVRCIGMGPQTRTIRYDPAQPLHLRYTTERDFAGAEDLALIEDITLTINAFFGWDFNSCEALLRDRVWHPIDYANPCPDSQVTSLHYHFPWLVKAYLRWSLFCAATKRPMKPNLEWQGFFDLADPDRPYRERVRAYAALAREKLEAERFEAFCAEHLSHLDEVANEFFGTDEARDAIRRKVALLFPPHEIEPFTEHFFQAIGRWREDDRAERERARGASSTARETARPRARRATRKST